MQSHGKNYTVILPPPAMKRPYSYSSRAHTGRGAGGGGGSISGCFCSLRKRLLILCAVILLKTVNACVHRYEQRFLQGAFGQVTYELIFLNVQESMYGTYTCHIVNRHEQDEGTGSNSITLAGEHFKSITQCDYVACATGGSGMV